MTDDAALRMLGDYLDDEDFVGYPDLVPLSPHLLWGLFCSYTEHFLCDSTELRPQIPAGAPPSGVTALEALTAARVLAGQLQGARWWMALEARKQGCSWSEVGAALGMSKQAAWEAFRQHADEPLPASQAPFRRLRDEYRELAGDSADS
jgi:hypothetical protein